jgi:hypothetical protein
MMKAKRDKLNYRKRKLTKKYMTEWRLREET